MKRVLYTFFSFIAIFSIFLLTMSKSYSVSSGGIDIDISGDTGSRVVKYYDSETGEEYSLDQLVDAYGYSEYLEIPDNPTIYFYKGKEVSESVYKKGYAKETADRKAVAYGSSGIRVSSTEGAINAIKDIYNNLKYGKYILCFSEYDNINWNSVKTTYDNLYSISDPNTNWYSFSKTGNQEVNRWGLDISGVSEGELLIDAENIRITKNELQVVEAYVDKLVSLAASYTPLEKISAAYNLVKRSTYLNDDGYVNDMLGSTASTYDALINRNSACVGFAIAFSYLMERMGIESYIVDNITSIDTVNKSVKSSHTYNLVKYNDKYYVIDIGSRFLDGVGSGELKNNTLNISSTSAGVSNSKSFDKNTVDTYLAQAKSISTTTTKKVVATSTEMQTKTIKATGSSTKKVTSTKTSKSNNNTVTNTSSNNSTYNTTSIVTQTSVVESNGTTSVVVNTVVVTNKINNGNNSTNSSEETEITDQTEEVEESSQTTETKKVNNTLYTLLAAVLLIFVIYEIRKRRRW